MSFLINPYAISTPPTYTYNTRSLSTSDASSYTFSGLNIGTADSSRFVIICVVATRAGALSVSSLTVGGNSATKLAGIEGGSREFASIYGVSVPSGTTANVVVNLSTTSVCCGVASYSLYNLSSTTPVATSTSLANPLSLNVNTLKNAIVIGIAQLGVNPTFTWSGLTERFDENVESGQLRWSGADDQMTTAETPRSISVSFSAGPVWQFGAVAVMR